MRDVDQGRVEGLMMALLVAEKNRKYPQRIQPEIAKLLQALGRNVGQLAIDNMTFRREVIAA